MVYVCSLPHFRNCHNPVFSESQGGGKQVPWTDLGRLNSWYIKEPFLLSGKPLINPNRISEVRLHAYWRHLYDLCQNGQEFTFKTTKPPLDEDGDQEEAGYGEGDGQEKSQSRVTSGQVKRGKHTEESEAEEESKEKGLAKVTSEDQDCGTEKPNLCYSDGDKLSFLHSMCSQEQDYQIVVDHLAQMGVSS